MLNEFTTPKNVSRAPKALGKYNTKHAHWPKNAEHFSRDAKAQRRTVRLAIVSKYFHNPQSS